jgi:hypothetical protein
LSGSINHLDGRGPSQVSLLWTALATEIVRPEFLSHHLPERFRLLELDYCHIDRRDVIRVTTDTETGKWRIEVDDYT